MRFLLVSLVAASAAFAWSYPAQADFLLNCRLMEPGSPPYLQFCTPAAGVAIANESLPGWVKVKCHDEGQCKKRKEKCLVFGGIIKDLHQVPGALASSRAFGGGMLSGASNQLAGEAGQDGLGGTVGTVGNTVGNALGGLSNTLGGRR